MSALPRISVVTASSNQGVFLGRTIESLLAQDYPNLEHIVVDGMSTDETPEILARYPHLRVIREPDKGQADAINKGFREATGDILCFLNADDTFMPGALHRVAQEIAPAHGRHVAMGRCRFIDEWDNFLGVEHPSAFEGHRRVLEIWKGHCIPQPAVFWTPEVWKRCGPLDEREELMLDYDLFCRFSRHYDFHFVDEVLATYRLHAHAKTSSITETERLEQAIRVSRRYWGSIASRQFWSILLSYGLFRLHRRQRAVALLQRGRELWRLGHPFRTLPYLAGGVLLAPDILVDVFVLPAMKPHVGKLLRFRRHRARSIEPRMLHPVTQAWRSFTRLHTDRWAGPTLVTTITTEHGHKQLEVTGTTGFRLPQPLELTLWIDGRHVWCERVGHAKTFSFSVPMGCEPPGSHELKIVSNTFVVPHDYAGTDDFRPLSFRLLNLKVM